MHLSMSRLQTIKQENQKDYERFKDNPKHPSLHFKK